MCDIWKRKGGREFHAADLDRHRESIRRLGVKHVVLTGGEPLLNRELTAICKFFRDLNLRITLLTTGLLLQKKADTVALAFDDIIISIDGPPEVHNRIRRVPTHFRLFREACRAFSRAAQTSKSPAALRCRNSTILICGPLSQPRNLLDSQGSLSSLPTSRQQLSTEKKFLVCGAPERDCAQ